MEELVKLKALLKARRLGDYFVIRLVEAGTKPSKHARNAQLILVVSIEGGWIKYYWHTNKKT